MTNSMTAFARRQVQLEGSTFCWEIRSVNHRYLDVSFRLPEAWRFLENDLRTLLRNKISRGKIECQLKHQEIGGLLQEVVVNNDLVNMLFAAADRLAEDKQLHNDLSIAQVLSWPGVVQITQPDVEGFKAPIINLFEETVDKLQMARAAEGKILAEQIQSRLERLNQQTCQAREYIEKETGQLRDKFLTRLSMLKIDLDPLRFEQELALLLTKMDVSEELDRLAVHIKETANALNAKEPAGRRLDFLMQELNREANTLSSKADSILLTQGAVEMKVLIEQMREQIQNIE